MNKKNDYHQRNGNQNNGAANQARQGSEKGSRDNLNNRENGQNRYNLTNRDNTRNNVPNREQQNRDNTINRDSSANKNIKREPQQRHGYSSYSNSQPRFNNRIKQVETFDDIKLDIARIEKEIQLEIKEIKSMRLGL